MKKLTPDGNEVVVYTRRFTAAGHHDAWPTHAVTWYSLGEATAFSGDFYIVWSFDLKDGTRWFYLGIGPTDLQGADSWYSGYGDFRVPNLANWYEGEAFNFVARPTTSWKGTDAQLAAFLAGH
jgi:hypothetical protein